MNIFVHIIKKNKSPVKTWFDKGDKINLRHHHQEENIIETPTFLVSDGANN